MNAERWAKLEELFHEVVDLPTDERAARIHALGKDDPELSKALEALIRADASQRVEDLSGRCLDDYILIRKLGQGGMGVVYLAERADVGGYVAIKVLQSELLRERFLLEQQLHARLVHPGIPQFHQSGETQGVAYFVLEYVDGETLTERCTSHKYSLRQCLQLFCAVCEAVRHAHSQSLIHRDLKPANILVKRDDTVRVLDFGVAKHIGFASDRTASPSGQEATTSGGFTPAYAAPELFRGELPTFSTDVYSLGVILYELLAGCHPYAQRGAHHDLSSMEQLACEETPLSPSKRAAHSGAARSLRKVRSGEWNDLDAIVGKAMAKAPQDRYPSVEALQRDIELLRYGRPIEARPDTWSYRTSRFIRRNVRALAVLGLTLSVLAGLTSYYIIGLAESRDIAAAEATRAERARRFMTGLIAGGDHAGPSQGLLVETLLERATKGARQLSHDPALMAELLHTVGDSFTALGKYDRAGPLLDKALTLHKNAVGENTLEVARDLLALGRLHLQRGALDAAEAAARRALEIAKTASADDANLRIAATVLVGNVLTTMGRYGEVVALLSHAIDELGGADVDPELRSALITTLGNAHFYLGDYDESKRLNERSLELDRTRLGDHPDVADSLINLAAIATDLGDVAQAEELNRQALCLIRRFHGDQHPETASALTIWARSLNALGRYDDAEFALEQALTVNQNAYPDAHPAVASTFNELQILASMRGDYRQAEHYAVRMLEVERVLHGDGHQRVGVALANFASIHMKLGLYAQAERGFREALAIFDATLPPDHLNPAVAHIKLGRSLKLQQRYAEAAAASQKGYDSIQRRSDPLPQWLVPAGRDLVESYEALGENERAQRLRSTIADLVQSQANHGG